MSSEQREIGLQHRDMQASLPCASDVVAQDGQRDEIFDLLAVACTLLDIEARDHREGREMSREQRKGVAHTLTRFTTKARAVLLQATNSELGSPVASQSNNEEVVVP